MKSSKFATILMIASIGSFYSCSKNSVRLKKDDPTIEETSSTNGVELTPYGYVPSSHVHEVSNSTYGTVANGHLVIKSLSTGAIVKDFGVASATDLKASNMNPYTYAAQLREEYGISLKTTISRATLGAGGNGMIASVPSSEQVSRNNTLGTSYVTSITGTNYTGYYMGADISNIQSFTTDWVVPVKPIDTTNLVTYFFWNGLSGGAIQPVLEWSNGRGAKYFIRNWYFANGQYYHGSYVDVTPGTSLHGFINFVSNTDDTTWTYQEGFTGYPSADVTIVRKSEATGLAECFEPYTSLMSRWPNQDYEAMTGIHLTLRSGTTPSTISWYGINDGPRTTPTGANSIVKSTSSSNGEIDFYLGDGTGITPDSTFQIVSAVNGTSLLDVYASYTANGTKVELWSPNSPISANQEWVPISLFNGYYKIASRMDTTKVLEIANGGTTNGTQADISDYTGAGYQQWKIMPSSNGYCILSPKHASSSALDDNAQATTNGNKIQLYTQNSTVAQQWKFNYVPQ
ncbi:RICIN domain-containing protein [Arachidicoccus sp.]|uniref:RICIN domain-containing protein n=1 Tax=Arachidicoccus sp. TaxID=1872624 RepID=UPI003D23775C